MTNNNSHKKVFISYSWDSDEHKEQVLTLANTLRKTGVDVILDRYEESPKKGWQIWMQDSIDEAEYVLIICTKKYSDRFMKKEVNDGKGATFECSIITQDLYDFNGENDKFIPVILKPSDEKFIPKILKSYTIYKTFQNEDYTRLYARLTGQAYIAKPQLGDIIKILENRTLDANLPEYKIDNIDAFIEFISKLNIDSLEGINIGLIKGSRTQRQEEILQYRFITSYNQNDINIIMSENIEGQFEIRIIASANKITGRQIQQLADEIFQNINHDISNLYLVEQTRSDLCGGQIIRYIMTYDY